MRFPGSTVSSVITTNHSPRNPVSMKIRTVCIGLLLEPADFLGLKNNELVRQKLIKANEDLTAIAQELQSATGHEVQTQRICTNSFEEWLLPLLDSPYNLPLEEILTILGSALGDGSIAMCSIGPCETARAIELVPTILQSCSLLSSSVLFHKANAEDVCPDYAKCLQTARSCLQLASDCGDLGNFRFCASFNCPSGIPFFPAAYHSPRESGRPLLTIGLENGDLLFLAFHGAGLPSSNVTESGNTHSRGAAQLTDVMRQICLPIQRAAVAKCAERGLEYGGIDASINPGLALPDSIGAGLESLLLASVSPSLGDGMDKAAYRQFGCFGTLGAVSTVTRAIKALAVPAGDGVHEEAVQLVGYSGLMLPVMEDLILAQRASEGRFSVRDLLTFSSVCGVGVDTVPIPGDTPAEALAGLYMETAALAFRLNKPLSCRVLPQQGRKAGEVTDVVSPYLCNTTVFAL